MKVWFGRVPKGSGVTEEAVGLMGGEEGGAGGYAQANLQRPPNPLLGCVHQVCFKTTEPKWNRIKQFSWPAFTEDLAEYFCSDDVVTFEVVGQP